MIEYFTLKEIIDYRAFQSLLRIDVYCTYLYMHVYVSTCVFTSARVYTYMHVHLHIDIQNVCI